MVPDAGSPHCSGCPDFDDIMQTLGIRENDPALNKVHIDEDGLLLKFSSGPPLDTDKDDRRWNAPEYRTAAGWLAERSVDSAQKIRESRMRLDLVISYPPRPIPVLLLDELSRLGIELWVFKIPPAKRLEGFRVLLRVLPIEESESKLVIDFLGLSEDDPAVDRLNFDEDEGIFSVKFTAGPGLVTDEDKMKWQEPELRTATEWLRKKSPEAISRLRESGAYVDVLAGGYRGWIPSPLMKEIVRLGLKLIVR